MHAIYINMVDDAIIREFRFLQLQFYDGILYMSKFSCLIKLVNIYIN